MKQKTEKMAVWDRISLVVKMAGMTTNGFARHIGLARGENLYQIKRGNNGISIDVADRICNKFPSVSKLWLLTGEGEMFSEKTEPIPDTRELLSAISGIAPANARIILAGMALCGLLANGRTGDVCKHACKYADDMMDMLYHPETKPISGD